MQGQRSLLGVATASEMLDSPRTVPGGAGVSQEFSEAQPCCWGGHVAADVPGFEQLPKQGAICFCYGVPRGWHSAPESGRNPSSPTVGRDFYTCSG